MQQRITFQYDLRALDEQEVGAYFAHRMRVAGYSGPPLLGKAARRSLYRASGGVPRLVNILAHKSLLLLYGEAGEALEPRHVHTAAVDTPAAVQPRRWWQWPLPRLSG